MCSVFSICWAKSANQTIHLALDIISSYFPFRAYWIFSCVHPRFWPFLCLRVAVNLIVFDTGLPQVYMIDCSHFLSKSVEMCMIIALMACVIGISLC